MMVCDAQALATLPLSFLRIFPLIIFLVLTAISGTERSKRKRWSNQYMKYGSKVSHLILCLLTMRMMARLGGYGSSQLVALFSGVILAEG